MDDATKKQAIDALIDEVDAENQGAPTTIERDGKPDYTLIPTSVYNGLLDRLHELEQASMTDEERKAEQDELIGLMTKGG